MLIWISIFVMRFVITSIVFSFTLYIHIRLILVAIKNVIVYLKIRKWNLSFFGNGFNGIFIYKVTECLYFIFLNKGACPMNLGLFVLTLFFTWQLLYLIYLRVSQWLTLWLRLFGQWSRLFIFIICASGPFTVWLLDNWLIYLLSL